MTAKYQFFRNPPSQGQDANKEITLHARIVRGETIGFQELCKRIAGRSTFSEGEVMGIMNLFKEEMIRALSDGDKVEVEGIGTYEATAQCPPIHDPKEIRAESIHFSKVVFRACKDLRKEMSTMHFERAADYRKQDTYTKEIRRERIFHYLRGNPNIQSSECMGLNRCSRYVAQGDLKQLSDEGLICRLGGPKVAVYVLPDKK